MLSYLTHFTKVLKRDAANLLEHTYHQATMTRFRGELTGTDLTSASKVFGLVERDSLQLQHGVESVIARRNRQTAFSCHYIMIVKSKQPSQNHTVNAS